VSDTTESHPIALWLDRILPDAPAASQIRVAMRQNPTRIDTAYVELLDGYRTDPATLLTKPSANEALSPAPGTATVECLDIPFVSICAHHFLPFFGTVDISYVPGTTLPGLGKISRLVRCRSRRLQFQEHLVRELVEDLTTHSGVRAARATSVATHMCVCHRGPASLGVRNRTTYVIGEIA
jgi:GTP cyclohydrolase IA